jgi:ketosteroid isomerase-like protein
MSIDYLLDRLAIQDTITRGCTAIDTRQPDLFDQVYTKDAIIDYSPLWGPDGYTAFRQWSKGWAEAGAEQFSAWQHHLTNMVVEINGDTATAMTDFYNPIIKKDQSVMHAYGRYHDSLARTAEGWRITHRKTEPLRDPMALG